MPWRCRPSRRHIVGGLYALCAAISTLGSETASATPARAETFYEDALRKFERQEFRAAAIQLKNALQQDKRMVAAQVLLARTLLKTGDLTAADAAFEEALKQGADPSTIALPLAQLYLGLGRADLVIERIDPSKLPADVKVQVLSLRGTAFGELGKTALASRTFEEARTVDPRSSIPLIAETSFLLARGNFDRARELAAKAVEITPNDGDAWNLHAAALHATRDLQRALAAYGKALAIEPRHLDARVARASLLIDLQQSVEAEADLAYLKRHAPGEPRAAYMRAVIASRKGDEKAVIAGLTEVSRLIDSLSPSWLAGREQLLMLGALAAHGLGNLEKARGYLNHVLVRNSRNLGAKKLFASICIDLKDYPRALTELDALYKASPEDPQVLYMLGSVHLANRDYVRATELLEKAAGATPSADINRALGMGQFELGRTEVALDTLAKVFAAEPGDARTGTTLALLYLRRAQPQKAVETAEAVVRHDPRNLTALNFLGVIRGAAGDAAGSRAAYLEVLKQDPGFRPTLLNLAKLDAGERRFDAARQALRRLLEKTPSSSDVLLELALLERRTGNTAEAVRHLRRAVEVQRRDIRPGIVLVELYLDQYRFDEAVATATRLIEIAPADAAAHMALGSARRASGDASGARLAYATASKVAGVAPEINIELGRLQLAAGHPEGAIENVEKALRARPDDPAALALRVEIERQRGSSERAAAALKHLEARHPKAVETAIAAGDHAFSGNRYAPAIASYRIALSRAPTTPNALKLVKAYVAAGETPKAKAFLSEWLKQRPRDMYARKALAETQIRAGDMAAAKATYQEILAGEPGDAASLNNYANVLLALQDPDAQRHAEKAVALAPAHPAYADTLGWILVNKGELQRGLHHLREARLRDPANGDIAFHLAVALAKSARMSEARTELQAALRAARPAHKTTEFLRLRHELRL